MAIVSECTGHTCHSQHHVLWYFFHQPTTTLSLEFTYELDIREKACFSRSKGGKVQSSCQGRFGARSECGHQPNSPARLSSLQSEGAARKTRSRYNQIGPRDHKMTNICVSLAHRSIIFSAITKAVNKRTRTLFSGHDALTQSRPCVQCVQREMVL